MAIDPGHRRASAPAGPTSERPSPEGVHRERAARFRAEAEREERRSSRISRLRFAAFVAAVVPLLAIETAPRGWWPYLVGLGALFLVLFGVLVAAHRRVRRARDRLLTLASFADQGLDRLGRRWAGLPPSQPAAVAPEHPYAADLDIFGDVSVLRLLGPPGTPSGRSTLAGWLRRPAPPEEARTRQEAVRELAGAVDFRDELRLRAEPAGDASSDEVARFVLWAGEEAWLLGRPDLIWLSRLLPAATLLLISAHLTGWVPYPFWAFPIGATLWLLHRTNTRLRESIEPASQHEGAVRAYQDVLELLEDERFEAPLLGRLRATLGETEGADSAHREIHRLRKRLDLADLRSSGMVHFPLQVLLLWDFHIIRALEGWRKRTGHRVADWVETAGRVEALSALAGLAHNHPDWAFPTLDDESGEAAGGRLVAEELGHPLLPPGECVRNDVRVGPPGTFLLVTGSNMSGKSTLLRAIGVNAVLAQAGGPVCATAMSMPPLRVWTSMRIQDSLAQGVSFFMAELRRLRAVVEAARAAEEAGGPRLLYLLDEILQGTNTAERQIAARRILRHLLATRAIGAVTTHDLTLADADDLRDRSERVHFREQVEKVPDPSSGELRTVVTFDYRLRPGIATSRNALQLMAAVGLGPEGDDEDLADGLGDAPETGETRN